MRNNLDQILDKCLFRIAHGEKIERCLNEYPQQCSELEPLLKAARRVSELPSVSPSAEFRQASRQRLMNCLKQTTYSQPEEAVRQRWLKTGTSLIQGLKRSWNLKPALMIMTAVAAAVCIFAVVYWSLLPFSQPAVQAAECTLTQLKGMTQIQTPKSTTWQAGSDARRLAAGDRIKTDSDGVAVLTFPDGSTLILEPDTEITIVKSEINDKQVLNVDINQSSGQIWSYLQPQDIAASEFDIQTPTTRIEAAGDSFLIQVDDNGATRVAAYSGRLNVSAQNSQVILESDQQTVVQPGMAPLEVQPVPVAQHELVCSADASSAIEVIGPDGAGTGFLSDGSGYNQIARSNLITDSNGRTIEIKEPGAGVYSFRVRSQAESVRIIVRVKQQDLTISEYTEELTGNKAEGWMVKFAISEDSQSGLGITMLSTDFWKEPPAAPDSEPDSPIEQQSSDREGDSGGENNLPETTGVTNTTQPQPTTEVEKTAPVPEKPAEKTNQGESRTANPPDSVTPPPEKPESTVEPDTEVAPEAPLPKPEATTGPKPEVIPDQPEGKPESTVTPENEVSPEPTAQPEPKLPQPPARPQSSVTNTVPQPSGTVKSGETSQADIVDPWLNPQRLNRPDGE